MSTQPQGKLPTELWIRVLQSIKIDKVELWMSIRHVSQDLKEAVETLFRDKHLPKTFIEIALGTCVQLPPNLTAN